MPLLTADRSIELKFSGSKKEALDKALLAVTGNLNYHRIPYRVDEERYHTIFNVPFRLMGWKLGPFNWIGSGTIDISEANGEIIIQYQLAYFGTLGKLALYTIAFMALYTIYAMATSLWVMSAFCMIPLTVPIYLALIWSSVDRFENMLRRSTSALFVRQLPAKHRPR